MLTNTNPSFIQNAKTAAKLEGILAISHATVPGWDTQTLHVKLLAKTPSGDKDEEDPTFDRENGVEERAARWFSLEELKGLNGEDGLLGVEPIELMQHVKKGK